MRNSGRERGIRTPGGVTLNGFQDRRFQPLSHLPNFIYELYSRLIWRRHPDSNWGIKALQAHALPLGYVATHIIVIQKGGARDRT